MKLASLLRSGIVKSSSPHRGEIVGIQYLRGFAALGVIVCHTAGNVTYEKYFGAEPMFAKFLSAGNVGVELFFVISGFIISIVGLEAGSFAPRMSRASFFGRRFARIIPLMWVAVFSYAAFRLLGRAEIDIANTLTAALLLPFGDVEPRNIWTLRHELIFYVVFALTFLGARHARWLLLAWIVSPLVILALGLQLQPGALAQAVSIVLSPYDLLFGAGVLLGLIWMKSGRKPLLIHGHFALLLVEFFGLMVLTMMLARWGVPWLVSIPALAVTCVAMVATAAWFAPKRHSPAGLLFGSASYAVYLFHPMIVSAALGAWAAFAHSTPVEIVVLVVSTIAAAAGVAAHVLIERPLVAYARGIMAPKPSGEAAPLPGSVVT